MSAHASAHVSAAGAARLYGLSEKTVRRWIRAGRLRADKRDGTYSVALAEVSALAGRVSAQWSAQGPAHVSAPGADSPEEPGTDIMRAEAMAAYTRSLLEPLTAALERSQGEVAELRERVGRQGAELKAAQQRITDQQWELAAAELSRQRDNRRLTIALAVAGALAVAAGTAPAWVR